MTEMQNGQDPTYLEIRLLYVNTTAIYKRLTLIVPAMCRHCDQSLPTGRNIEFGLFSSTPIQSGIDEVAY